MTTTIRTSFAALAILSAVTVGCARDDQDEQPPVAQATTETATPLNQPTKVVGCLRAGDAANTYVLTTSQTEGEMSPATYHLAGATNVNLQEYVGHKVEVDGRLTGQQQVATTDVQGRPAEKAEGTTGKPEVETSTKVAVRHLEVKGVRSIADECEQK